MGVPKDILKDSAGMPVAEAEPIFVYVNAYVNVNDKSCYETSYSYTAQRYTYPYTKWLEGGQQFCGWPRERVYER